MGGVRNGVTEEVPGWDLNKKAGCHVGRGQCETVGDNVRPCGKKRGERACSETGLAGQREEGKAVCFWVYLHV